MYKIETNTWNEYKIEELFDIHPTNHYNMTNSNLFMKEGSIPVIVNSSYNNGVGGYVSLLPTEKGGIITFSDTTDANSIFYQPNDFIGYSHVQGMYPKFKNVTNNIMRFIATIFKIKALTMGYDYANKFRRDIAEKLKIKLPSKKGEPDWEYMESYMKNIMQDSEKKIENLQNISKHKNKIDVKNWQEFLLGGNDGLFNIVKGTRLTKANMKEGNINFIGSSAINNGVTNHISNSERVHSANLITVSYNGSIGEAFYQDEPFWASDDVNVFYPKFEQNFEIAMFLIPLIRKVGEKYKFVDKWKIEDMCNDKIKLPKNKNGEPDWKYIENYMKNIMQDTQSKLDKLVCYKV